MSESISSAIAYFESKASDPERHARAAGHVRNYGGNPTRRPPGPRPTVEVTPAIARRLRAGFAAGERIAALARQEGIPYKIVWRLLEGSAGASRSAL